MSDYAERYVLRTTSDGKCLGVNTQDAQIRVTDTPEHAWIFRTHDGAVTHALWIGEVHGETPDVIKLDLEPFSPSPHPHWHWEG